MDGASRATAPYGTWASSLGAREVAAAALDLSYATAYNGRLYWIESRPAEQGRSVLMAAAPRGPALDVTPATSNVRSRVHEYGGRPYTVARNAIIFCEFADQRLYMQPAGNLPDALTAAGYRYADGAASSDGRTIFLVREDHSRPGEAVNAVVALDLEHELREQVLFDAADFVAYPRPSMDGRLAFVTWNHPNMPWDSTALHVGRLGADGLSEVQTIAGGAATPGESLLEPVWDEDGTLYFLSDRSGYWNLFRWRGGRIERVLMLDADLGGALWNLGASTYALTGDGQALVRICRNAVHSLGLVELTTGELSPLVLPFQAFGSIGILDARTGFATAAAEDGPPALITFDLRDATYRSIRTAGPTVLPPGLVSRAEPIEFPTRPSADGAQRTAHAFFHPPHNPRFLGPAGSRPPLIVLLHGGPTAHASSARNLATQFWTTRGFAVVNVNYGGSTGFGRAYRDRLLGEWGVVDLNDSVAAVDYLASTGRVDGDRVAIRGGSAGGYTVLAGLAFTRRFAVGINYFGVADLEALAADTHKFESRYLDRLIAPLPEGLEVYRARSPIHHLDALEAALITFQGSEDMAVPPDQSRRIVAAVRERGKPVAYIEFEGEQHGFRSAQNIARAMEAELYFLGKIFGFTPADALEPVPIDNLAVDPFVRPG
jgi:dipeptidyl aminopeptidase/acylaminoacyl peptidase